MFKVRDNGTFSLTNTLAIQIVLCSFPSGLKADNNGCLLGARLS